MWLGREKIKWIDIYFVSAKYSCGFPNPQRYSQGTCNRSGSSMNAAKAAWQMLTGAVKMTLQSTHFITGPVGAGKRKKIRSRQQITVIPRFPVRNRTRSSLTLFWIIFRSRIQHHRCKTCTLTIHIRLRLLWRISPSASAMIQIQSCLPGHSICFRSSYVKGYLQAWKDLHCLRLYRYAKNYWRTLCRDQRPA